MIVQVKRRRRKKRIVILGGGFGGVYAAIHLEKLLARQGAVEISLVSRDNFFLFTPMLHEIAASDLEITNIVNPLRKLLRKVEVLVGDVNQIDLPNKRVSISLVTANALSSSITIIWSSHWDRSPTFTTSRVSSTWPCP